MNIENFISSGIIEQYVLGMCNSEEKQEVELFRKQHISVNNAILKFEETLEAKFMNTTIQTKAETDNKILATLKNINSPVETSRKTIVRNIAYKKYLVAASIALLAGAIGYTLYQSNNKITPNTTVTDKKGTPTLPDGDYDILQNPNITSIPINGVPAHSICRCTLYLDKTNGKAYVKVHHLMPATEGNAYQIWAMVDGKQVNLGNINEQIKDKYIEVSNVPLNANQFIVTLEKNGKATQPTPGNEWLKSESI